MILLLHVSFQVLLVNYGQRLSERESLAPQTEFEICLTASAPQNKSLSFCLTPGRTRAMNVITNLRPSEKLEKGRSLLCTNLQCPWALRWCGWAPR